MKEDPFLNPINPDKVAQNPGLLPYAHTAGGAVIKPEDTGKTKGRSILAMRQQTDRQMNQLYEQMEVLAKQANIADRKEISERIYDAAMGFEPIISETYYMYEKEDTAHYDYFDYIDEKGDKKQYEPDSDMDFLKFKQRMKEEWVGRPVKSKGCWC